MNIVLNHPGDELRKNYLLPMYASPRGSDIYYSYIPFGSQYATATIYCWAPGKWYTYPSRTKCFREQDFAVPYNSSAFARLQDAVLSLGKFK